jgi:hypothetical protein
MPIDIAIEWMIKISSFPEALGKTFHITNPLPFSIKEATKQTLDALNIKIPIFPAPKWFVNFYFSFPYWVSFIVRPIRYFAKKLYYYKYYMTESNIYNMKNTKEILGGEITNQFHFSSDFIKKVAGGFIKKIEQGDKISK